MEKCLLEKVEGEVEPKDCNINVKVDFSLAHIVYVIMIRDETDI